MKMSSLVKKGSVALSVAMMGFLSMSPASAASTVTVDKAMHFRLLPHKAYIEFRWFRYAKPKEFKFYEIVRSELGGPSEPDAGDILATTTNRYSTNATDKPPKSGTYFYRLCVDKKDDTKVCSKAVKVVYEGPTIDVPVVEPSAATSTPDFATSTEALVPLMSQPLVPSEPVPVDADLLPTVQAALPGELQLSVTSTAGQMALSWTPFMVKSAPFKAYKLVRSFTNPNLSYPTDGYLAHVAMPTQNTFVDTVDVDPAMTFAPRYYRVCAVDLGDGLWCGNPVRATLAP